MLRLVLGLALMLFAGAARAGEARWIGPLAESAVTPIFAPIVLPGTPEAAALRRAGYVQQEYLISGQANVYAENGDGSLAVRRADVPYVTRLVVVRPRDPRRFNGIVQLGFNHPQLASGNWSRLDALVLRSGMAYAALMIGGDPGTRQRSTADWPVSTPLLFKWADPARYAAFQWGDEDGIRWDVIGQAALLLRDTGRGGPLAGLRVRRVYSSGWSYLGSLQRSYINFGFHARHRRPDGGPAIDGYLLGISAGGVGAGHVPLNSFDPPKDRTRDLLRVIDSPVIELTSEMEAITNVYPLRAESDAAKGGLRIYELGGVSHRDNGIDDQSAPAAIQLTARRHPAVEPEVDCTMGYSDVPMRDLAQAALVNLDRWVSTGQAPPRAARLLVRPDGKDYVRDAFGNPQGGIRAAQLDVPLVHYGVPPESACGGMLPRRKLNRLPVQTAVIAARYPGGQAQFLAAFDRRLGQLVRQGWLLAEDARRQAQGARAHAAKAFARKTE